MKYKPITEGRKNGPWTRTDSQVSGLDRTVDMFRIKTLNVRGLNDDVKEREMLKVIADAGVDVCGFTIS